MLRELRIRNFVLIKDLTLEFDRGFNVLTGETGAGKSIIIDALGLLLGERVKGEIIRLGAEEASVEAVFDGFDPRSEKRLLRRMEELGLEPDSGGLFIKRTIRADGKGRCYVNSSPAPLKVLEKLGDLLVDIHGQHEHQSLLHGEVYSGLLDAYGGLEEQTDKIREKYQQLKKIDEEIAGLENAGRERSRQEDHLRFQIEEIEQAEIVSGEEEPLEQERRKLQHSGFLAENAQAIQNLLIEGTEERPAVVDCLAEVQRRLQEMADIDDSLREWGRELGTAAIQIEETGRELVSYAQNIENDPTRLEQIEQRLHLLKRLKTKYGASLEDVLLYLEQTKAKLQSLDQAEQSLAELQAQREVLVRGFIEESVHLSHQRQKAAVRLSRAVTKELKDLGMDQGQFLVQVDTLGDSGKVLQLDGKSYRASAKGIDRVEFLVNTNPGQQAGPLRQIASGGEVSRIALAIKSVLAAVDRVGSLVFDEIDSGIGGNIADVVGSKFRKVARDRQIICITHLPQIAAKAHKNFRVSKFMSGNQTNSRVEPIEGESLTEEIARMLGGSSLDESLQYSKRMLQLGRAEV